MLLMLPPLRSGAGLRNWILQQFESGWLQPPTLKPNIDKTFNICGVFHLNAKCCIWYEGDRIGSIERVGLEQDI